MSSEIRLIPCLKDNYAVLLHDSAAHATALIDAPEAAPIEKSLTEAGWRLTDLLVTHHHADHTNGIAALKQKYQCRVIAPGREAAQIPGIDVAVREGDVVSIGTLVGRVVETPGHTVGHISYWFNSENLVFVGDTLFSVGCGRVLEGTAEVMWQSLLKLRNLPAETRIYCGHEYTAANIKFALTVEATNPSLRSRAEEVARLRATSQPTIPTTIGAERATNPFLRADVPTVAGAVGLEGAPAETVFARIRAMKDKF